MRGHDGHRWFSRAYWTEVGVIPRWQLVAVYLLIAGGGVAGFHQSSGARDEIQQSRHEAVVRTCREQNARHNRTIKKLDSLIAREGNAARGRRARQRRDSTVALIDALVPKKNCKQRADALVG